MEVLLCNKVLPIRFNIQALMAAHATLKAMGNGRSTSWQLADTPYDLPEEIILLHVGLNEAKKEAKDTDLYKLDDVYEMVQNHLDMMAEELSKIDDESKAMEEFQKRQQDMMKSLSNAIKRGIGFGVKVKKSTK
jgi:hypothetical protein